MLEGSCGAVDDGCEFAESAGFDVEPNNVEACVDPGRPLNSGLLDAVLEFWLFKFDPKMFPVLEDPKRVGFVGSVVPGCVVEGKMFGAPAPEPST